MTRPEDGPAGYGKPCKAVSFCLLHPECRGRVLPSASGKSVLIDNAALGGDVMFDSVIKGGKSQDEIFEIVCRPYLKTVIENRRGSSMKGLLVLAVGPSGSGKTFCVTGGATKFSDRGLIPRTLSYLFEHKPNSTKAEISFYEIYKEEVIDLLSPEGKIGHSDDLTRMLVENEPAAYQALFTGDSNRHFEKMTLNPEASRGHAVFEILLNGQDKITFVDLAVYVPNCRTSTSRLNKKSQDALKNVIQSMAQQEKWRSSRGRDSVTLSSAFRQGMLTLVLKPYLQSIQHGTIDSVLVTCLGPGGPSTSKVWADSAKADNQQWTRFAESWWKAFHKRKPVPPSKVVASRRVPIRGGEEEEEEEYDEPDRAEMDEEQDASDDIDWSEEPTIAAVPPIQLAAAQHIGTMIAANSTKSSSSSWNTKPPVHPVVRGTSSQLDDEPPMTKSVSSLAAQQTVSRTASPATSLSRSYSTLPGMKITSVAGSTNFSSTQPLNGLQAFSMASTPLSLTPQEEYRSQLPPPLMPSTPPVVWTSPQIGPRTPTMAPGTPQQLLRTPLQPMRGTVGAPRPLTPQSQFREELMLTPQSLTRYRQMLPTRTLDSGATDNRGVATAAYYPYSTVTSQSPSRQPSSTMPKSKSVAALPGTTISAASQSPVYVTRGPAVPSPQVYYDYQPAPRVQVSNMPTTYPYIADMHTGPTSYTYGSPKTYSGGPYPYTTVQSRPTVQTYAPSTAGGYNVPSNGAGYHTTGGRYVAPSTGGGYAGPSSGGGYAGPSSGDGYAGPSSGGGYTGPSSGGGYTGPSSGGRYVAGKSNYTTVSKQGQPLGQLPSRMSVLTKQQPPSRQLMQPLII